MGHFLEDQKETIIEKCDRFREEGQKFYKTFEKDKVEQERFYRGEHWVNNNSEKRPKNHIFQIVESEIPLLMDPMPSTDVLAHDEAEYGEHAIVLKAAKDHVYREQNITIKDSQAFRQMLKTGVGYQYVDFDPDGERGEGSILVKNLSRTQVTRDPASDNIDQARYVIIDSAISDDDGQRRFPKTWKKAKNQPMKDLYVFAGAKGSREKNNDGTGSTKEANRYDSKDISFIEEFWVKDYSLEEIPDDETQIQLMEESVEIQNGKNPDVSKWEDHLAHVEGHADQVKILVAQIINQNLQTQPLMPGQVVPMEMTPDQVTEDMVKEAMNDERVGLVIQIAMDHIEMHKMYIEHEDADEVGKRPKYPNNLRLIIKTGKIVHFDGAPDVDDGLVPLVEFECYKDEGPAEGIIKNIIPMQKTINELDEKEFKGLKLNANPGWIKDEQSGVDEDTLTDEDGLVVTKQQGTEVSRLQPGQVSTQLENRSRREYEAMNRIEGTGETVFGEAPKGDPSGVMLRRLQMQSLGRIRLKSTMIASSIYRRDLLITTRIMAKWSTERKLRSEDAGGKIKFLKFDPRLMRDFTYELALTPGSTSGQDAETISATYKEMFLQGQISLRQYAMLANLPKKHELLKSLDETDQQVAQSQELQAQNEQLQKDMLMMKANLAPQLLNPEEIKIIEQITAQEQQAALTQNPMAVG